MKKRFRKENNISGLKKIIILVFLFLFSITVVKVLQRPKNQTAVQPKNNTVSEKTEVSGVTIKDFLQYKDPKASFITLSQNKDYHIFYIPAQEVFFISIVSYPFDKFRPIAEADFLDKLGIEGSDACDLNVKITTPGYANPDKAGQDYNLSFCR